MERRRSLLLALAGLALWAICFAALYAALSLGCATRLDDRHVAGVNVLSGLLVALWCVHLAPFALVAGRLRQLRRAAGGASVQPFLLKVSWAVTATGFAAMLWLLLPIAVLPPCR